MTKHNSERTAAIVVSGRPRSTEYRNANSGPQTGTARAFRALRQTESSSLFNESEDEDGPQWFYNTGILLPRHCRYGEVVAVCAADLNMSLEEAQRQVDRAPDIGRMKIGLTFQKEVDQRPRSCPVVPKPDPAKRLAAEIARQLGELSIRKPKLVEDAVMAYAESVQTENRMMLTSEADANHIRVWMQFVQELKNKSLSFRFTAYKVKNETGDLKHLFNQIGIRKLPAVHLVNAHNQNSRSALKQLGIDITSSSERADETPRGCGAFRYVMAIAAISQPWLSLAAQPARVRRLPPDKLKTSDTPGDQNQIEVVQSSHDPHPERRRPREDPAEEYFPMFTEILS